MVYSFSLRERWNQGYRMFESVQIVIDVFGRPIFVVPFDLPAEGCRVAVTEEALDFMAGTQQVGHVDKVDSAVLLLVAQQKEVGLIAWPSEEVPCPDHLTHIAVVQDKRGAA
jgi:hypothetical protein